MTHVLVTGGAGYIGSHTCKALAQAGYVPVTIDDLRRGHRDFVRWGPHIEASIDDRNKVIAAIRKFRPIAAIHFAAYAYVGESVQEPMKYWQNNVVCSALFLQYLLDEQVSQVVFSSTCAVYGVPQGREPLHEETPRVPVSPYGATKLAVEHLLEGLERAGKMRSVRLRYFNAAGADADGEVGEDHSPETHLIPLVLQAAGTGQQVTIFGDSHPTADGTCIRDYIHVSDLAAAHVLALDYLMQGHPGCALNLGTGRGVSVREVINVAQRVTGLEVVTRVGPPRIGDPPWLVADARRASELLKFTPENSQIENVVESAWRWHCARHQWGRVRGR